MITVSAFTRRRGCMHTLPGCALVGYSCHVNEFFALTSVGAFFIL